MLDLSAGLDTIDHDILMSRLRNVYGITGDALDWFRSYLTGGEHRENVHIAFSAGMSTMRHAASSLPTTCV